MYFCTMEDWILRTQIHQDWIGLFFFINFLLISALFILDSERLQTLFRPFSLPVYLGKYNSEKNLNYLNNFNVLSFLVIVNTLALLFYWALQFNSLAIAYAYEFYYFLISLYTLVLVRFILVRFLSKELKLIKRTRSSFFKLFSINTKFSFYLIIFLFFYEFSSFNKEVINVLIFCLVIGWSIVYTGVLINYFRNHPKDIFYLFLYLCMFKVAPWLWYFRIFIETKL
jgi:hypothetical protein